MKGRPRVRVEPCKFCGKEFKRQEHLDRHLRTHTQEKPFGCACGRLFSRQDLLYRHKRLTQCISPDHTAGSQSPGAWSSVDAQATPQPSSTRDEPSAYSVPLQTSHSAAAPTGAFSQDMRSRLQAEKTDSNMGIVNSPIHQHDDLMDGFSSSGLAAHVSSQGGHEEMSLDTQDFGGQDINQFDVDFLLSETDLLSNYLIGIFPPRDDGPSNTVDNAEGHPADMDDTVRANTVAWDPPIITQPASEQITVRPVLANDTGINVHGDAHSGDEPEVHDVHIRGATEPEMHTAAADTEELFDASHDAPLDGLDAMDDDIWPANPWVISRAAFTRLEALVGKHASSSHVGPESGRDGTGAGPYRLPSRQVLSRYVMNFVRSFHPHLPFLHLGTTCLDGLDPVLLMTLAATGSFYGFEHTRGYAMYAVTKSVIIYELEKRRRLRTAHLTQSFPAYAEIPMPMPTPGEPQASSTTCDHQPHTSRERDQSSVMLLQSLLVLLLTMLWLDGPLMEDALAMSSQLTELLRDTLREEQEDEDGQSVTKWTESTEETVGDEEERDDDEYGERAEKRYRDMGQESAWKRWGWREERLRTLYSAYFVLNILSICFGVPHPLSSMELDLVLPSSEAEFAAPTWMAWLRLRRRKKKAGRKQATAQWQEQGIPVSISDEQQQQQRPRFLTCLHQLLAGQRLAKEVAAREYGNYMLIQTLVIHINRERQIIADRPASYTAASSSPLSQSQSQPYFASLPPDIVSLYARALNAWQAGWDSAIDASPLDPNAVHGPLAFNATAMLRLAHVQLVMGWCTKPLPGDGCRSMYRPAEVSGTLRCRDPRLLARGWPGQPQLSTSPQLSPRSPHVSQAVVHAICALRIPVRVGIPFVARGRTGHWSVQHALSTFSCAQLLAHWLEAMYQAVRGGFQTETAGSHIESSAQRRVGIDVLRNDEKRLIGMVERLIEETHLAESLGQPGSYPGRIRRLAVAALKLWADTCKGIQVFEIVHVVGAALSIVAEGLEDDDHERSGRSVR